jgi:hypothetical protein
MFLVMYRVEPDDKDRTYLLFEAIAKKVTKDMSSNVRIQAINAYLKSQGIISSMIFGNIQVIS